MSEQNSVTYIPQKELGCASEYTGKLLSRNMTWYNFKEHSGHCGEGDLGEKQPTQMVIAWIKFILVEVKTFKQI